VGGAATASTDSGGNTDGGVPCRGGELGTRAGKDDVHGGQVAAEARPPQSTLREAASTKPATADQNSAVPLFADSRRGVHRRRRNVCVLIQVLSSPPSQ